MTKLDNEVLKKVYKSVYIPSVNKIEMMTSGISAIAERLNAIIKPMIDIVSKMQINYSPFFEGINIALEEARKNPDSIISWLDYSEKLSDYIWTIPYKISSEQLKNIFEKVHSEDEFDIYMKKYYTKTKINNLINDIDEKLPIAHKKLYKQIVESIEDRRYALSIVGLMSIIDELCSFFLKDKGTSARQDMFIPIIEDLKTNDGGNVGIIDLMIISNNINVIYDNINFNQIIDIKTNKKARRNPCMHGRSYSNKKIDVIMLLNTVYNLLLIQEQFGIYKDSLIRDKHNKVFYLEKV